MGTIAVIAVMATLCLVGAVVCIYKLFTSKAFSAGLTGDQPSEIDNQQDFFYAVGAYVLGLVFVVLTAGLWVRLMPTA